MKKIFSPLSMAGFLLALAGLFLNFEKASTPGALIAFAGFLAADKASGRYASKGKLALALFCGLLFSLSAGASVLQSAGMGLFLLIVGHRARNFFLSSWGVSGFPWFEPVVMTLGMFLTLSDAMASGHWLGYVFCAYAVFEMFQATMGLAMALGILRRTGAGYAVEPGAPAPDFTLDDESGAPVSLASFRGKNPVLLIFVRGDWCPSCHITLRTYARNKERFLGKDIVLLAIGPDPVGVNQKMVKELEVPYRMLSDTGQRTAMAFGVQIHDDKVSKMVMSDGVPLPASFLVDKQGTVRYTSRPERAGEFLDPNTLFPVLEGLKA